jgi:heme-degrading monooxygenase HmoA
MIARVWHGIVPVDKGEDYGRYLAESDLGVKHYQRVSGNRGAYLLKRAEGERVHFLLISLWDSREAIQGYAGPDIERAQYFPFDRECLLEPEDDVKHYEVLAKP